MPPIRLGKIVKLAILCLVVGLVLTAIGVEPLEFWSWAGSAATGLYDWLVGVASSAATSSSAPRW